MPSPVRSCLLCFLLCVGSPLFAQLSFEFTYTDNNTGFNDPTQGADRRAALSAAGELLASLMPTTTPATITFSVNSNNENNDTLASAGSDIFADTNGFHATIAQHKAITGEDMNGATADGEITWNFFHNWDLDDDIAPDASDFISTAMHEILHALGFGGAIDSGGEGFFDGAVGDPNGFATFDQFLVNGSGTRFVNESAAFNVALLGELTGGSSMFFNGANAMAANGGNPVVIFSPNPWQEGSSASHTDDETYTGNSAMLMNAATNDGPGIRTLSAIELGILRDVGYVFSTDSGGGDGGSGGSDGGFAYLTNISVRTRAGSGAQTLIAGFAVAGGDKPLLVRGIGPTLGDFGVSGALADPRVGIFQGTDEVESNDNWSAEDAAVFQTVGAFALPDGSLDAALTGNAESAAYTAQVTGVGGTTGIALAEIYDTAFPSEASGPRLTNVSARSQVGTGAEVLVAGFVIGGTGTKSLLIRGVGPTLGDFGVSGVLADPQLTLFRSESGSSTQIGTNDNWDSTTVTAVANRVGAFAIPAGSNDAALLVDLAPGAYTVQLSGVNDGTGVGLIEVYDAD